MRRRNEASATAAASCAAGPCCGGLSEPSDCTAMKRSEAIPSGSERIPSRMFRIPDWVYEELGELLSEEIDSASYFNGAVLFDAGCMQCLFIGKIIVYRRRVSYPDGEADEIFDLVPIAWEFHTVKNNEELTNDFNFSEFMKHTFYKSGVRTGTLRASRP